MYVEHTNANNFNIDIVGHNLKKSISLKYFIKEIDLNINHKYLNISV